METFRSLGYAEFDAESDSLLTPSNVPTVPTVTTTTTPSPLERQQALPKDNFGFVLKLFNDLLMIKLNISRSENNNFSFIIDLGPENLIPTSSSDENTFIKVKPTLNLDNKQFTKLNLQFARQEDAQFSKKSAQVIQKLINRLSIEEQTKFLAQFTMLNFAQQQYAYKQFVSTPENVQQFALKQFLTLEPHILTISIDREIQAEEEERKQDQIIQTQSNSFQNQISNTNFLNNQNNEFLNQNNNPVKQSRLIDQSLFQTNF